MLARRALSRAEVIERLGRRGFAAADITREVRRLAAVDLLDDELLARRVCEEGLARGQGRRAIAATLRRRKVSRQAAADAVAALEDEAVGSALARAFARAARRHPGWPADRREREKLVRSLLARGFALDEVRKAMVQARASDEGEA